jgi:hypothetical protein
MRTAAFLTIKGISLQEDRKLSEVHGLIYVSFTMNEVTYTFKEAKK